MVLASCVSAIQMLSALLPAKLPVKHLGRQWKVVQVVPVPLASFFNSGVETHTALLLCFLVLWCPLHCSFICVYLFTYISHHFYPISLLCFIYSYGTYLLFCYTFLKIHFTCLLPSVLLLLKIRFWVTRIYYLLCILISR